MLYFYELINYIYIYLYIPRETSCVIFGSSFCGVKGKNMREDIVAHLQHIRTLWAFGFRFFYIDRWTSILEKTGNQLEEQD